MKPFRGVIGEWGMTITSQVEGLVVSTEGAENPTVTVGKKITTQAIVAFLHLDGFYIVETKSSRYVLVGHPRFDRRGRIRANQVLN